MAKKKSASPKPTASERLVELSGMLLAQSEDDATEYELMDLIDQLIEKGRLDQTLTQARAEGLGDASVLNVLTLAYQMCDQPLVSFKTPQTEPNDMLELAGLGCCIVGDTNEFEKWYAEGDNAPQMVRAILSFLEQHGFSEQIHGLRLWDRTINPLALVDLSPDDRRHVIRSMWVSSPAPVDDRAALHAAEEARAMGNTSPESAASYTRELIMSIRMKRSHLHGPDEDMEDAGFEGWLDAMSDPDFFEMAQMQWDELMLSINLPPRVLVGPPLGLRDSLRFAIMSHVQQHHCMFDNIMHQTVVADRDVETETSCRSLTKTEPLGTDIALYFDVVYPSGRIPNGQFQVNIPGNTLLCLGLEVDDFVQMFDYDPTTPGLHDEPVFSLVSTEEDETPVPVRKRVLH